MNKSGFIRKIVYILAIVVLLLPLYGLGAPGLGLISKLRTKHKMGQANLGKLDPTSESMRLASLGMKGIASTILWLKADYYKEEKYFDRFSAALNQIALLQPHFISVWQHQAHNLSYNVSPEFEDYRQRYEWVKKGIDYLVRGTKYNDRKPILQYDLGHYLGYKLGKADEHKQYRSLFSADTEFHNYFKEQGLAEIDSSARGYDGRPDNWLVGRLWFDEAVALYESGAFIKKSPHLLYSYSPLWQMYYAEAIESEGVLDSSARLAWETAGKAWQKFGTQGLYQFRQDLPLTLLGEKDAKTKVEAIQKEFDDLTTDAKIKAIDALRANLPKEMLAIYDTPADQRLAKDYGTYVEAVQRLNPTHQQIIAQLPREKQLDALKVATRLVLASEYLREINSYRSQVNYAYWEVRAKAEQQEGMIEARRLMYEADKLIDVADIKGATDAYEKSWVLWDKMFRRFPSMMTEEVGEDVLKSINRYKRLVENDLDESFVLYDFMRFRRAYNADSLDFNVEKTLAEWTARAESENAEHDFFDSPASRNLTGDSPNPMPAEEPKNSKETPKPEMPATEQSTPETNPQTDAQPTENAAPTTENPGLPPTLKDPDSQS